PCARSSKPPGLVKWQSSWFVSVAAIAYGIGAGAEELGHELGGGSLSHRLDRASLHDASFLQRGDFGSEGFDVSCVVRNQHGGTSEGRDSLSKKSPDRPPARGVERREWLVEQQEPWLEDQRTRECDSLLFPARQPADLPIGEICAGELAEHRPGPLIPFGSAQLRRTR